MLPPLYSVVPDDPFKVRPRQGELALQMQPQHQVHSRVRQSMSETQLAPMLQRQHFQPSNSHHTQLQNYPPPPLPYMPPVAMQVPHHHSHLPARAAPMQLISSQHLPISQSFASAPVSAPAMTSHLELPPLQHLSQPARNAQLLSILNANGPSHNPIGLQRSMITPHVGVVNTVEHR